MSVDPSGGYTVGGALAGQWIDRLREGNGAGTGRLSRRFPSMAGN
jgi:hypothetical protein